MFGTISGHNSKDITEVEHFFGGYREGTVDGEDGGRSNERKKRERTNKMERGGGGIRLGTGCARGSHLYVPY